MKLKVRFLSAFLALLFSLEQTSFAASELKPKQFDVLEKPSIHFNLPESIASVEDAWKSTDSGKLVYLIQDAHTNNSGQINLSKALDILFKEEKDLKYVFLEAGQGNDSLSFLRQYSTQEERQKAALKYLKQGLLHGEEYLDLTSNHEFVLWGVEDMVLYQKALESYKFVAKNRDKYQGYLKRIQQTIDTLRPKIYNPVLLSFEEKQSKFLEEEISLTDYFDILVQYAKQAQPSSPNALVGDHPDDSRLRGNDALFHYPHLKALKNLKKKENHIDFKKANEEQQKAIQSLPEADQKELLELSEKEKSPFKLGSQEHKELKGFYALLEVKLKGHVSNFPNLHKYFDYLKVSKTLNPKAILDEQKSIERERFFLHSQKLQTNNPSFAVRRL